MSATCYIRRCLELAAIAALAGDTGVGALIVRGNEVVGRGQRPGGAWLYSRRDYSVPTPIVITCRG